MTRLPLGSILIGDVRERLAELPESSIDCIITSPPYFRLRDYGVAGQIGLEGTITEWVDELHLVLRGLARVLKPSGSIWLNLGDSYSRHVRFGAPPKSLLLGPERLALKLIDDGWTVRNKVVWAKSNTLPSSVSDRLATKSEVVYFLTQSRRYHFDLNAIRVPHRSRPMRRPASSSKPSRSVSAMPPSWSGPLAGNNSGLARMKAAGRVGHPLGKNPGDIWTTAASNYRGAHFATFPPALVIRPLLATCPERVCVSCGVPWVRGAAEAVDGQMTRGALMAGCGCGTGHRPGIVLDPFAGVGTVGLVAERHRRDWLGIELNPAFAAQGMERIEAERNQEMKERR